MYKQDDITPAIPVSPSAEHWNAGSSPGHVPHPNNPTDYCSTVPPSQQAAGGLSPPSVLVPVAGVLKRDGKSGILLT